MAKTRTLTVNSVIAWLQGLLRGVAAMVAAFFTGAWWAKEKAKRKQAETRLKELDDARAIHRKLISDSRFAKRVRDRFTR